MVGRSWELGRKSQLAAGKGVKNPSFVLLRAWTGAQKPQFVLQMGLNFLINEMGWDGVIVVSCYEDKRVYI